MTKLLIITIISFSITVIIVLSSGSKSNQVMVKSTDTKNIVSPTEHRRPADQTFLTYPEWFLVYSPDEFATYTRTHTPDQFPFFGHVRQFWQSYKSVYRYIKGKYPFNTGYHVMIMVIGGSTTVEYVLRSCYENTIGRLSAITANSFTEEDYYAAAIAQQYVDFIKVTPWYEFDFIKALKGLWKENPTVSKNMIRKWERRYILSSEYCIKALYGWVIKKMTKASYEEPILFTSVVVDKLPVIDSIKYPLIKEVSQLPDHGQLLLLPRYDAFKDYTLMLAKAGASFTEIAGNTDVIMVTLLVPASWKPSVEENVLFLQPILTNPQRQRVALIIPVDKLSKALLKYDSEGLILEHIYDF